jgi:hypothetical protein
MLNNRTFNVVLVNKNKGTGEKPTGNYDTTIAYDGIEKVVQF